MKSTLNVQVDAALLLRLHHCLRSLGGTQSVSDAVTAAVTAWLEAQTCGTGGPDPAGARGYQWKTVFLPEGTVLRSWSYGEHNYARVEGDQIMHLGRAVSPNQFAQSFARTTRNAWTDLSVRRPGDKRFTLACRLRQEAAEPTKPPVQAPTSPQADPVGIALSTLLSHLAAALKPVLVAPPAPLQPPAEPRNVSPEPGWDLPERRQCRYRMEDVAY